MRKAARFLLLACSTLALSALTLRGSAAPGPAPIAAPGGEAKAEGDAFVAEIKVNGAYKPGKEGSVQVTLEPKGNYHLNEKYPMKFMLADAPAGVTFPKPILLREDGSFDAKKGVFNVPFVASKSGRYTIAGKFSFSVCSDANCVMEKKDLEVVVEVN